MVTSAVFPNAPEMCWQHGHCFLSPYISHSVFIVCMSVSWGGRDYNTSIVERISLLGGSGGILHRENFKEEKKCSETNPGGSCGTTRLSL